MVVEVVVVDPLPPKPPDPGDPDPGDVVAVGFVPDMPAPGTVVVVEGTTGVVVVGVTDVDGTRLTEIAVRDVVATCAALVVSRAVVTRFR